MMNSEFNNGLRNPGLYSLISHKSAAADEKRTLVGNDTTWGLNIHSPAKSELESCSISKKKTATYLAGLRKSG
jgi:hypothetical protein